MKPLLKVALVVAALAGASASAQAAGTSYTGTLTGDNDVALFTFALAADGPVTLRTWSYSGGVNAAGSLIAAGGFDPFVSLFFGTGDAAILIGGNDDLSLVNLDSLLFIPTLLAGTYTAALTQVANFPNGPTFGDGFLGAGNPGFDGRTSAWALDILIPDAVTPVPEPSTFALTLLGLAAGARWVARRPRLRA